MKEFNEYYKTVEEYYRNLDQEKKEKQEKELTSIPDGHYFISAYEKGDDYSTVMFVVSDLTDAVKTVECNSSDWIEGIYNYAILWKIPSSSYVNSGETEIIGVYRIEDTDDIDKEQGWIDFEVKTDSKNHNVISFDECSLLIKHGTGPDLTPYYRKNRLLKGFYF